MKNLMIIQEINKKINFIIYHIYVERIIFILRELRFTP